MEETALKGDLDFARTQLIDHEAFSKNWSEWFERKSINVESSLTSLMEQMAARSTIEYGNEHDIFVRGTQMLPDD